MPDVLAEPSTDMVRAGLTRPLVHAYPSDVAPRGWAAADVSEQQIAGNPRAALWRGVGVVVGAGPGEAGLALVRGDHVLKWLQGSTSIGGCNSPSPGDGLLAVVGSGRSGRVRVVRLTRDSSAESFSVDRAEWAGWRRSAAGSCGRSISTIDGLRAQGRNVQIGEPHDDPRIIFPFSLGSWAGSRALLTLRLR
jgi:hypothetical protein